MGLRVLLKCVSSVGFGPAICQDAVEAEPRLHISGLDWPSVPYSMDACATEQVVSHWCNRGSIAASALRKRRYHMGT